MSLMGKKEADKTLEKAPAERQQQDRYIYVKRHILTRQNFVQCTTTRPFAVLDKQHLIQLLLGLLLQSRSKSSLAAVIGLLAKAALTGRLPRSAFLEHQQHLQGPWAFPSVFANLSTC
jgi:hypothetical protein